MTLSLPVMRDKSKKYRSGYIQNIGEANRILLKYVPLVKQITGKDITLSRMMPLMEHLGNPEQRLRIIHVAGTSGKTSTAYYISSQLTEAGQKTGLTVSPHMETVTERVQINGVPLPETVFCKYLSEFMEIIEGFEPTYYELLVAFAYWVFAKERVDYAVIEVGLGGLQDATNIAHSEDKVCVITDIGLDHTHVLGTTIPEIAAQKAGIIHEGNAVFAYRQSDEVMEVIESRCKTKTARLYDIYPDYDDDFEDLPLFQQRNWHLAATVVDFIVVRDNLISLTKDQKQRASHMTILGRMEIYTVNRKMIILDGAHNPQKLQTLVDSLRNKFPDQRFSVLIGMLSGKEITRALKILQPITHDITSTNFSANQDMPRKSIKADVIAAAAQKLGITDALACNDAETAIGRLIESSPAPILVTGSFFLLNSIRPLVKRAIVDK